MEPALASCAFGLTNSAFLESLAGGAAKGQTLWVTNFVGNPDLTDAQNWMGQSYKPVQMGPLVNKWHKENAYFSVAALQADSFGNTKRRKTNFARLLALVVDDVDPADLIGPATYILETSPGKHQIGIFIDADDKDATRADLVDRLVTTMADKGMLRADTSGNNSVRYVRLPVSQNHKPRTSGHASTKLIAWNPQHRLSLEDAAASFGVDLDSCRSEASRKANDHESGIGRQAELLRGNISNVLRGERLHESLNEIAASLVAAGVPGGSAVNVMRALMDTSIVAKDDRWLARFEDIPRSVSTAEEKFGRPAVDTGAVDGFVAKIKQQASDLLVALGPLNWDTLSDQAPEPPEFVVPGWFPRRYTSLLSANGGVGKSNLSLQLAVSLAVGAQWLGLTLPKRRVLVISAEDDSRIVHFRVSNICNHMGVGMMDLVDTLTVYDMTEEDCIMWREGAATKRMAWLAEVVERHQAEVLIIDNASDVFADNENDRTQVRGFMRCLNRIAKRFDVAVLLLAHVDKASVRMGAGSDTNSTFSGSTAWNNSSRSRWAMTRETNGNLITLKHEKSNHGALEQDIQIEFDVSEKVLRLAGTSPGNQAAQALAMSATRAAILRLLLDAENADQKLSMNAKANNNAYQVLKSEPGFPKIDRSDFFSILFKFQRDGLLDEVEYSNERKKFKRITLTEVGRLRAAQGSGAPAMWKGGFGNDD